jgi:hypothetical protein
MLTAQLAKESAPFFHSSHLHKILFSFLRHFSKEEA